MTNQVSEKSEVDRTIDAMKIDGLRETSRLLLQKVMSDEDCQIHTRVAAASAAALPTKVIYAGTRCEADFVSYPKYTTIELTPALLKEILQASAMCEALKIDSVILNHAPKGWLPEILDDEVTYNDTGLQVTSMGFSFLAEPIGEGWNFRSMFISHHDLKRILSSPKETIYLGTRSSDEFAEAEVKELLVQGGAANSRDSRIETFRRVDTAGLDLG